MQELPSLQSELILESQDLLLLSGNKYLLELEVKTILLFVVSCSLCWTGLG